MSFRLLWLGVVGAVGGACLWCWWRQHPTSRPFAQRLWVDFPHPFITRARLYDALEPRPGQRVVAIGVGSGRYLVPVAAVLGDTGLAVGVDLHADMLRLARRRSARDGRCSVRPVAADARALPFADASFDAAWFVSSLGQLPHPAEGLAEAARVVRPGGRVVVGEVAYDPHGVSFGQLRRCTDAAGLRVDARFGGRLGYFARMTAAAGSFRTVQAGGG